MAKKRAARQSLFIACEGRNTEPLYFESIAEQIEDEGNLVITIYPDRNNDSPKTDALGLIREAQSRGDEFDELWVVFDKNGYTKHAEAFALAEGDANRKKVNIAFSSIAFEHWILLHFTQSATYFVKSDCKDAKEHTLFCGTNRHTQDCHGERCVAGFIRQNAFCSDYAKSNNYSFYFNHKEKTEIALKNAAWLRFKMAQEITKNGGKIHSINPYTNVDVLVKRLLNIHTNFIWSSINESITVENLILKVEKEVSKWVVSITNEGKSTFLLNSQNLDNHFKLLNQTIQLPLTIDASVLIKPNETKAVLLNFETTGEILLFKFGQHDVFIELT